MDVTGQVTKAPGAFWATAKRYWLFALVALAAIFVVAMAKKDAIVNAFTSKGSTAKGDRLPGFIRSWLGLTTFAIAFGAVFLGAGDALASVCCAAPPIDQAWSILDPANLLGVIPIAIGMTQFGAPDVLDCVTTQGGKDLTVTDRLAATAVRTFKMDTANHANASSRIGKPIPRVATDATVELTTAVTLDHAGTDLEDDDFGRLIAYLDIQSPIMGALTTPESHTGPIVDLVERHISEAFERSGDAPIDTVECPEADTESNVVTKYLTRPFAQRWLAKPLTTAPWLGLLHNTSVNIGLAADTCLASTSAAASVTGDRVLKVSLAYVPVPVWYYPLVPYSRVARPASGSNGLTFEGFGAAGPACTDPIDFVYALGQLSELKGLGGNLTFDEVTHLYGADFGMPDVQNLSHLVKQRIRAQYSGNVFGVNYTDSGNYPQGTLNPTGGMRLDKLLFLLLIQPSIGGDPNNLRRMSEKSKLTMRYTTSVARTGEDVFYIGSLRKVAQAKAAEWSKLEGSRLPASVEATRHFAA